jgi:hypothetical protein
MSRRKKPRERTGSIWTSEYGSFNYHLQPLAFLLLKRKGTKSTFVKARVAWFPRSKAILIILPHKGTILPENVDGCGGFSPGRLGPGHRLAADKPDFDVLPVFVDKDLYENYYNGFANSVLWPLFHYFSNTGDYESQYFDAYVQVNQLVCRKDRAFAGTGRPGLDTRLPADAPAAPAAGRKSRKRPSAFSCISLSLLTRSSACCPPNGKRPCCMGSWGRT